MEMTFMIVTLMLQLAIGVGIIVIGVAVFGLLRKTSSLAAGIWNIEERRKETGNGSEE